MISNDYFAVKLSNDQESLMNSDTAELWNKIFCLVFTFFFNRRSSENGRVFERGFWIIDIVRVGVGMIVRLGCHRFFSIDEIETKNKHWHIFRQMDRNPLVLLRQSSSNQANDKATSMNLMVLADCCHFLRKKK